ncbi:MAG: hypothetical protein HKN07_00020, partial [Acidimicrobiia bacterium]|nr:hypothetical protein [Acidimicrobiia bacterium]
MAELLDIAETVVGWANDDEHVEVVVVHDRDTEIRVYEGDVEQFTAAESFGVGVRVIADNKQGFAWAGTLDEDVLGETLADARDNAVFGTIDENLGLADPDGVEVPSLGLYNPEALNLPTEDKIAMAVELEARTRAADDRISGMESVDYVDGTRESALVSTAGIRSTSQEMSAYVMAYALATQDDDTQLGFGFSVGRNPAELDIDAAAADAADRATRMLGATQPDTERVTVIFDPFVTAQFLSILGGTMSGEAVQKGY